MVCFRRLITIRRDSVHYFSEIQNIVTGVHNFSHVCLHGVDRESFTITFLLETDKLHR